eukprot:COSAG02_NODE_4470_length_5330_cov_25.203785_5_plen_61_part_00
MQDIERDEIDFISKTLGCTPVTHPDSLTADKLGTAGLVEDISVSGAASLRPASIEVFLVS